jgi:hypothetical protein
MLRFESSKPFNLESLPGIVRFGAFMVYFCRA